MRILLAFAALLVARFASANEPLLKPNDVVAIVGGEDMVVASELGYLEATAHAALPDYRLKFRSLAWEGDTVFEQRRDLNYPSLETQLEKIGATVVIAQFGVMEALAGESGLEDFKAAYGRLIQRFKGSEKRRVILIAPNFWGPAWYAASGRTARLPDPPYTPAVREVGEKLGCTVLDLVTDFLPSKQPVTRDGVHLLPALHRMIAVGLAFKLQGKPVADSSSPVGNYALSPPVEALRDLVVAKNRLWFNYSRPQNWAFLAGDRTNQPSSRDHIDRNKRWFPAEMEQFVPLIEEKEKDIWNAAATLNR